MRYFREAGYLAKARGRATGKEILGIRCATSLDEAPRLSESGHEAEGCKRIGPKGQQVDHMVYLALLGGVLKFSGNIWGYINASTVLRILRREGDKERHGEEGGERCGEAIVNFRETKQ